MIRLALVVLFLQNDFVLAVELHQQDVEGCVERGVLRVAREAPRRAMERLPFHVWMALAKAGPAWREDDPSQQAL